MIKIEGVYQGYLKKIPNNKITTLSPKESYEIEMKISEACRKKYAKYHCFKQNKGFLVFVKEFFIKLLKNF